MRQGLPVNHIIKYFNVRSPLNGDVCVHINIPGRDRIYLKELNPGVEFNQTKPTSNFNINR